MNQDQTTPQPLFITLTLVETDANLLIAGLGKLPAEASYGLISRLVGELQRAAAARDQQAQQPPREEPPLPPQDDAMHYEKMNVRGSMGPTWGAVDAG